MTNINVELFKRYGEKRKREIVENLTDSEVLNITTSTIERIVKEQGTKVGRSHNKDFNLRRSNSAGNGWNSTVEGICLYKKELWIDFYVQYNNTDTSTSDKWSRFISSGDYVGRIEYKDRYNDTQTERFRYDRDDKISVIRAILKEYLDCKYAD